MDGPWTEFQKKPAIEQGPWTEFQKASVPESDVARDTRAQLSEFTQHPSRGAFEQLSTGGKIMQSADDIARLIASGGSMGFADKVAAGGDPQRLEAEHAMTEAARDRAGWAGTAAEVGGMFATPVGMAKQGATLVGKGVQAIPGVKGLLARTGLMAAEGAGYGAADAAGHDEDIGTGAITGLLAGGAGNVLGEGVSSVFSDTARALAKAPPRLSVDDLKAAGNDAYKASEAAGVIIKPEGMQTLRQRIVDDMAEHGFSQDNEPGAAAFLKSLDEKLGGNVTLKGLDTLRKTASNGYRPGAGSNNKLIGKAIKRIDELIDSADPTTMSGLDTPAGTKAITEARDYWHRARKLETVEKLADRGELNAAATGSGGNVENATRQQIKKLLTSDRMGRGFNKDELDAARKAVLGSNTQNALRLGGKLAPTGNGLMMAMHLLGAGASGGATIPLAGVGIASKMGAEALQRGAVKEFTDLVARGGEKASAPVNALQQLAKSKRDAIVRLLMTSGIAAGGP